MREDSVPIDESTEWTDDDMRDWMASGPERLDEYPPAIAREQEEREQSTD